ncbi:Site-specific DNA recombinase [Peptoniphilus asaccharolyticus DSM 20463]|nr:recombinase family protein [Peptoniphilus asaccharolyticus]MBL7576455.1 recombinase family protein [Peptoniphilus asaccharolyticus]SMB78853.1 Site-specific DNA recombinase [Peptoniphilus asaccharolyticus DSM 20463]
MIYGYARVSTHGQEKYGNGLQQQIDELKRSGADEIFQESFTGTKIDRPELNKLLSLLEDGDTLMFTKLDRVARSAIEGSKLINSLLEKNVRVHILNIGIMDNTPASKLIRQIFFAFAEFERDLIVERTQEGRAIAKLKSDYREGRPKKFSQKQINHALELKKSYSYKQVSEMTGISVSTLKRANRK